jgi:hypothetical protein
MHGFLRPPFPGRLAAATTPSSHPDEPNCACMPTLCTDDHEKVMRTQVIIHDFFSVTNMSVRYNERKKTIKHWQRLVRNEDTNDTHPLCFTFI